LTASAPVLRSLFATFSSAGIAFDVPILASAPLAWTCRHPLSVAKAALLRVVCYFFFNSSNFFFSSSICFLCLR
jgi:hypothetical protein